MCIQITSSFQALYKEDFEKNKGKGFSVVVDTPEMQRLKKTQDQISDVSGASWRLTLVKLWESKGDQSVAVSMKGC